MRLFSTTVAVVPTLPVSANSHPTANYVPLAGLYGALVALSALMAISYALGVYRGRRAEWQRSITLLQKRGTLERLFQTHYWSEDYRTEDASEDYRSTTMRDRQPSRLP